MKLVLLLLDIFVATDLVMLGNADIFFQCMGNRGFGRSSCKKSEQAYFYCRTYQTCCLQSYMRISLTGVDDNTNWSNEKHWPRIP
ncbi:beta-defensin 19-like [Arvicanthis niloticus]|uniref:beta-defensin 19-like n=1 Tax=Arvicanthis niloticus TaxID=61156 RepID=UPI0014861CCF|nr:beta-defensin 19-like [Arvicanthis niloticus]